MALLKNDVVRDNIIHFLADIPAYAYIAYINLTQVFLPTDYDNWERFFLKHGWFILLAARLFIAVYDIYVRLINQEEFIDEHGRIRRKTMWMIIKEMIKSIFK